jgi:hypothetical protein
MRTTLFVIQICTWAVSQAAMGNWGFRSVRLVPKSC